MTSVNLGNQLNQIVGSSRAKMFEQGELAQLTHTAFEVAAQYLQSWEDEKIEISFPVGYKADKTTLNGTRTYSKEALLSKYAFLASN